MLPLTYTQASAFPEDVLRDGRILFEAGFPLGQGPTPEMYLVYADGSGVESYRCDHGRARWGGMQLASGDVVFTHGASLARFTSPLAHEVPVAAPRGVYSGAIAETASGALAGECAGGDGPDDYAIKLWTPGTQPDCKLSWPASGRGSGRAGSGCAAHTAESASVGAAPLELRQSAGAGLSRLARWRTERERQYRCGWRRRTPKVEPLRWEQRRSSRMDRFSCRRQATGRSGLRCSTAKALFCGRSMAGSGLAAASSAFAWAATRGRNALRKIACPQC